MSSRRAGLELRVRLAVPAKRAFAAVGTLAGVRGWWTPLVSGSTKEGGRLTLRFRGLDETIRFRVEACRAPSAARWLCMGHDSLADWSGTRLSFSVRARGGDASELELVHEGLVPALACYESCRAGWHHFLESLVAWAETGCGQPFGVGKRSARPPRSASATPLHAAHASRSQVHRVPRNFPLSARSDSVASGREPRSSVDATRPSTRAKASREPSDGRAAYAALVRTFARDPRVTLPSEGSQAFGASGLKVDGKVFAMLVGGALVLKLPRSEVDAAVAAKHGERFSMGRGRVMKEWLVVHEAKHRWPVLARRARAFVGGER